MCFLILLAGAACSNPHNTALPKDISSLDKIKPAIEKLTQEEKELLSGYIMRHTIGAAFGGAFGIKAEPIPDGMTIGKAIEEQRGLAEKQKAANAAEKLERAKIDASRKALADQMAQILSSRLTTIGLHKASYRDFDMESSIELTIEFENKGNKSISGLKGISIFKDKFGDKVAELPIKIEQEIPAGKKVAIKLSKRFNQFIAEDRRLSTIDAATTNFSFSPDVILFSDGSKFEAPQVKESDG